MIQNLAQPDPGSFMAPAGGGGSAILSAMARRGMLPPTAAVGPASPNAAAAPLSNIPPAPVGAGPSLSGVGAPPVAPPGQPTPSVGPLPPSETEMIIKALSKHLSDHGHIQKVQAGAA